jgi:hypothetical protein
MGAAVVRINDLAHGLCNGPGHAPNFAYIATYITGSSKVLADGLGVVRVGDMGITNCGHHIQAIAGSDVSQADGQSIHRVGDAVIVIEGGNGTAMTGSDTVSSD